MPNEEAIEPEFLSPVNFDPEKISRDTARVPYEPSVKIYARDPELKKDPFKAIGEVHLTEKNEGEITELLIGSAKLETAEKELNLTPKQNEVFKGVRENIDGAIAWAKGATEDAKDYITANKVVRKTLIGAQVVGLTLTSAGCVNAVKPSEAAFTETPVPAETQTVAPAPTVTPTETATPTVTPMEAKEPAENIWQLSPDGHVYYNEAELYDGLFTINKEHPENVEKYWEDTIRGLWNLNNIAKNTAFISQFPTDGSLIKYLNDGGGAINNLWIPTIYPDARRQFWYQATMTPVNAKVDLSKIAISVYKPTKEEIYNYSPSYASGTKYISYLGGGEQVYIDIYSVENTEFLKLTFRSDILMDTDYKLTINGQTHCFAISDTKTPEDNLKALTQMLNSWKLRMQTTGVDPVTGAEIWRDDYTPGLWNINSVPLDPVTIFEVANTITSPLSVRQ